MQRTRHALHQAFLRLILSKGYDATTVEDICAAADVGRSTFYQHFTGKDDLKRSGLDHLRRTLHAHQEQTRHTGPSGPLAFSRVLFDHARDHLDHYRALVGTQGGALALDVLRTMLRDAIRRELADRPTSDREPASPEFTVEFLVGAYMSVLVWWLDHGAQSPPAEMDRQFRVLAQGGLSHPS